MTDTLFGSSATISSIGVPLGRSASTGPATEVTLILDTVSVKLAVWLPELFAAVTEKE